MHSFLIIDAKGETINTFTHASYLELGLRDVIWRRMKRGDGDVKNGQGHWKSLMRWTLLYYLRNFCLFSYYLLYGLLDYSWKGHGERQ